MGSSGGGASGKVSHSAYLETCHKDWLDHTGVDTIEKSITEVMDSAIGNSPWTGLSAYNPDADIASYEVGITDFAAILAGLSDIVDWNAFYASATLALDGVADVNIAADVAAYQAILDDNIAARVLPRFRRGMQDINAVVSSAFPIGEAIIEAFQARDVNKYAAALRLGLSDKRIQVVEQMTNMMARRIGWTESYTRMLVESKRIKIVAKKEQTDQDAIIDEQDAKWDMEVFQYGGNLMAAIGGGTAIPNMAGKNRAASALGGAMSGAVAGGMIGSAAASTGAAAGAAGGVAAGATTGAAAGSAYPVVGTVIGAVVGAAVGLLSSN
jgi:hypothetical protein